MPNVPCNKVPVKFVNCCQVMDCINIQSSDNSITVEVSDCGVDLTQTGNNLDNILKLNEGDCVSFVKEFIDGVLNLTPVIDFDCLADEICGLCPGSEPAAFCPAPLTLTIDNVLIDTEEDLMLINNDDSFLINNTDTLIL